MIEAIDNLGSAKRSFHFFVIHELLDNVVNYACGFRTLCLTLVGQNLGSSSANGHECSGLRGGELDYDLTKTITTLHIHPPSIHAKRATATRRTRATTNTT